MNIKNHNELLSFSPYIMQPCNFDTKKGNCESNQNTTTSLKALALQYLQRNRQCNYTATDIKKLSNSAATNNYQMLHEFILKNYGITMLQLQKFLGEDWQDYAENQEALKLWAEMLSEKETIIKLNILTKEQYENLFN